MNVELYQQHIEEICRQHGIEIGRHSTGGRACRKKRWIKIRPVKSAVTYAIALHEIGHVVSPGQRGRRLEEEVDAWQWAKANALRWTKPMKQAMQRSLASYLRWAKRRKGVWLPPVGHAAWKMAGLL